MTYQRSFTTLMLTASILAMAPMGHAQVAEDEVVVTGIRQSLENALTEKRNSDSLVEVILAEDIGKLPDQNLAEVLENITGIQITRTAGVGTGVQIRGTNANRIEINGVSTVGSGSGRSGINFEDVNASIIAGVEVIKASEAKTIEGSVGGTVNLRTIRPLDLKKELASVRVQGEQSSLTTEGIQPRISAAVGKKWENASGQEIGFVLSGSYTEQEAVSFRPRTDRDNVASPRERARLDCARPSLMPLLVTTHCGSETML
jgi:TonB-dependent receptor